MKYIRSYLLFVISLVILVGNVLALDYDHTFFRLKGYYGDYERTDILSFNSEVNLALKQDPYRIYEDLVFDIRYVNKKLDTMHIMWLNRMEKRLYNNRIFVFIDTNTEWYKDKTLGFSFGPGIGIFIIKKEKIYWSLATYPYMEIYNDLVNQETKTDYPINIENRFRLTYDKFQYRNKTIFKYYINEYYGKHNIWYIQNKFSYIISDKKSIGISYDITNNPFENSKELYLLFELKI